MTEWILTACVLTAFVIALRYLLRGRISLRLQYALWALVLVRLLVPVQFGTSGLSVTNVVPQAPQPASSGIMPATEDMAAPGYDAGDFQPAPALGTETEIWTETKASLTPAVNVTALDSGDVQLRVTDWGAIARIAWLTGALALGLWLLASNLRFRLRLLRSRKPLEVPEAGLPVYVTAAMDTPCLFGLFRPAIYLTPETAADEAMRRHAVAHEYTHYRHGDHIWALLRGLCLALHWYNPLVWWAAELSRRDGELACDEATIRRLGEAERSAYGRTLIAMTCRKRPVLFTASTTMNAGRRSIRERIMLIAKKPRTAAYTLAAVLLLSAAAVGCTFTGAEESPEPTPEPSHTVPQDVIDPVYQGVTVSDDLADLPESVRAWAAEYVEAAAADYMDMGAEQGFAVLSAQVTDLRQIPTGTAGLNSGQNLYLLEYRIAVDAPDKVPLTGGMRLEDDAITEWGSAGQPCLLLHWEDGDDGVTRWERVCVTNTEVIEQDYGTPKMLETYSSAYTAAAMELYDRYLRTYTLNGVSIVLDHGFTLRETGYVCLENEAGVLVSMSVQPEESLTDRGPGDQPLELEALPVNDYGDRFSDYTFEGEYHYNVFRPCDGGVLVVELSCREYDTDNYKDVFPVWAASAVVTGEAEHIPASGDLSPQPVIPTELPDMIHLFKYWNGEPQATRYELTAEGLTALWEMFRALPLTEEAERPQVNGNYYALGMYWGETRATVWFYESDRVWIEGIGETRGYACPAGSVDYALLEQIYASQPTISKSQADIDSAIAAARDCLANSEVLDIWYDEDACTAAIYEKRHMTYRDPDSVSPDDLIAVGFDWIYNGQTMTNCTLYLERSGPDASWAYCDRSKAPTYAYPAV